MNLGTCSMAESICELFSLVGQNKAWLFSGIGGTVLIAIVTFVGKAIFKNRRDSSIQTIRSGKGSKNIQAGRDVRIGSDKERD